jgi:hypothetical protein
VFKKYLLFLILSLEVNVIMFKRYFINKDTCLIVMNHSVKVLNSSDFQMFLSNELYKNHSPEWLMFKIDCLDDTTGIVNQACVYQGITIWIIFFILAINVIC